jgi:hypothetical protein
MGMSPLDPAGAGWTEEDVILEAEHVSRLPNAILQLKRRLV